uniref:Uncharacterized protein n=1 Tax=Moniliophthora roreri TaxID=221103 RepID=A0A0W0FIP1_MONRR
MAIISNGKGPDLQDLAAGVESPMIGCPGPGYDPCIYGISRAFLVTQAACLLLLVLWVILLFTVTSIKQHGWYLLLVGGLGMLQNAFVAGARWSMGTTGIHLTKIQEFGGPKVMHVIMDFEMAYLQLGRPLLDEFFPENLCEAEVKWWAGDWMQYDQQQ